MKSRPLLIIGKISVFFAVFALAIWVVMLLWNALMPALFGITAINFWQSTGIILLSRLLFGGFGKHAHHAHHAHYAHQGRHGRRGFCKKRSAAEDDLERTHMHYLRDELKGMTRDERREYIRNHFREVHGWYHEQADKASGVSKEDTVE